MLVSHVSLRIPTFDEQDTESDHNVLFYSPRFSDSIVLLDPIVVSLGHNYRPAPLDDRALELLPIIIVLLLPIFPELQSRWPSGGQLSRGTHWSQLLHFLSKVSLVNYEFNIPPISSKSSLPTFNSQDYLLPLRFRSPLSRSVIHYGDTRCPR